MLVNGEGLDDFSNSKTYAGKLKSAEDDCKRLGLFDVVVSNPPFSISGFKDDVPKVDDNFLLSSFLGAKSSEIECLFIERAFHLLRDGGAAGLILPLSILNNEYAVYREARKLTLIRFKIVALVELGNKTFKPTNTATVGLFMQKRNQCDVERSVMALCKSLSQIGGDEKVNVLSGA